MQINLFSIVLLLLIIQCFTKNKEIKKIYISIVAITAIVEVFIEQGNFIVISGFEISYATMMEMIMLIFSIGMIFRKKKISKKVMTISMLLMVVVVIRNTSFNHESFSIRCWNF